MNRFFTGFTKEGKYRIPLFFLMGVFVVQLLFLGYMNLFAPDKILNFDGANAMLHGIEIWKNKALFLPGWHDTTQLEFDMAAFLAAPLYGITKNIFLSYGIANIVFAALYVWVVLDLFKNFGKSLFHALIALVLIFTPYCIGMIDYYSMMFFQAAFYVMRVLIPLLTLNLLVKKKERRRAPDTICLLALLCVFSFVSGLSCGIYVLVSAFAPIFVVLCLEVLLAGDFRQVEKWQGIVMGLGIGFSLLGIILIRIAGYAGLDNQMQLVNYQDMTSNVHAVILSFFMVLDAFPSANTPVLSLAGIVYLLKALVALALLAVFIIRLQTLFKTQSKEPDAENDSGNAFLLGKLVSFLLLWNVLEFIFSETRYSLSNPIIENRYYLIPVVALMVFFPFQMEEWSLAKTRFMEIAVNLGVSLAVFALAVGCDYYVVKKFDADSGYI
ncbi:MAG: hypothetical protein IJU50_05490, partial [Lachnospiraceae bacterium]|nr:hypothetical protein [Lachnospiraceae bacterium]